MYHSLGAYNPSIKRWSLGLPWWSRGWESICQCREHRFDPCSGEIPHALGTLTICLCTPTAEPLSRACELQLLKPMYLESVLCNKKPPHGEACTLQWVAPQRKPSHSNKDPVQPKINKFFKNINKIHLKITLDLKREREMVPGSAVSAFPVCVSHSAVPDSLWPHGL